MTVKLVIYVKKGKSFFFKQFSDLKGKKVGINLGWSYGEAFDSARNKGFFTVEEANTNEANLKKLVLDRIDCFIVDQLAASQLILKDNLDYNIERLMQPVSTNKTYVVFSKSVGKKDLLNRFDRALSEMKEDGSYEKIVEDFIIESTLY